MIAATSLMKPQINANAQNSALKNAVDELKPVAQMPTHVTRTWLGAEFWANRLQDWRLDQGEIQCLAGEAKSHLCTAGVLTRELNLANGAARLSVCLRLLEDLGAGGFGGFLIGAGAGKLDYRAAALVQGLSGAGGGLLCVFETNGRVPFREHTDEENPLAFSQLPIESPNEPFDSTNLATKNEFTVNPEVLLQLDLLPRSNGKTEMRLTARVA